MTLPVQYALQHGGPEAETMVRKILEARDFRSVERSEILDLVEKSGGLTHTQTLAEEYANRAIRSLKDFPPSVYRDAILSIPEFILTRVA